MMSFYKILFSEDVVFGVAYTLEKTPLFALPYRGVVQDWSPLMLELRAGQFADYLASNLGCRLCSRKLADILRSHASPTDELQWLPVDVRSPAEERRYWILHFPNPPDVLDRERTIFADDFVVKPVLSSAKLDDHHVFTYPEAGELPLFIAESVRGAILTAACSGLECSRAAIH